MAAVTVHQRELHFAITTAGEYPHVFLHNTRQLVRGVQGAEGLPRLADEQYAGVAAHPPLQVALGGGEEHLAGVIIAQAQDPV